METKSPPKFKFTLKSEKRSFDFTIIDTNKELTLD